MVLDDEGGGEARPGFEMRPLNCLQKSGKDRAEHARMEQGHSMEGHCKVLLGANVLDGAECKIVRRWIN